VTADRTYGFSKSDAEALVASIGTTETEIPQLFLGGGGGSGTQSFGFLLTTGMTSGSGLGTVFAMADVANATSLATGVTIKARAFFGNLPTGTIGQCELHGSDYIVTNAACPAEVIVEDPE
jgi:hypothetical protein